MLFHSTYGLRPAVREAADRLRAAGHEVWTPDLFEGRTFDTVEEGMEFKEAIGKEELLKRAVLAAAPYSDRGLVYAGFSLGASVAQTLALGDDKARGLLLPARHVGHRAERARGRACRCSCTWRSRTRSRRTTG